MFLGENFFFKKVKIFVAVKKKLKLEEKKKKSVRVVSYPVSWVSCCETWLKEEIAEVGIAIAKKI